MFLLKLVLKIIVLPLMLAVTLLQWAGVFLVGFSAVIFNLFAGLCFMVAVLSCLMGIANGATAFSTLIMGFVIFMIPHIGEAVVTVIAVFNSGLRDFLRS